MDRLPGGGSSASVFRFAIGHAIEPFLLAILVVQAVYLGGAALNNRPIMFVGRISYGLYLFHMIGFALSRRALPDAGIPEQLVAGAAATLGIALMSYILVERPAMSLKHSFQSRSAISRAGAWRRATIRPDNG